MEKQTGIGIMSPYPPSLIPLPLSPFLIPLIPPEDWPWSSVRAHINGADDGLVTVRAVLDRIPYFAELLSTTQDQDFEDLRLAEGSGRPLGTAESVTGLEPLLGRPIARRAPGRKPTASVAGVQLKLLQ